MQMDDSAFAEWESDVFGYGYGSGEHHVLSALKSFFAAFNGNSYDYERIEASIGPVPTWLLINTLCRADVLDYGTSPRYGWLTVRGEDVRSYVQSHTVDQMAEAISAAKDERAG